jgi:hypothetical protein
LFSIGFSTSMEKARNHYKNPNEIHKFTNSQIQKGCLVSVLCAFEYGFEVLFVEGYFEVFEDVCSAQKSRDFVGVCE